MIVANWWQLFRLRAAKLMVATRHPLCWRPLMHGVAATIEHLPILRGLDIDGIIDVGANRGQFTLACRVALPRVPIVAFEPIPQEAERFRLVHGGCPGVTLVETALGAAPGSATLHLSESADSSSLLPIGSKQVELFASTREIGTIQVPVGRLDDFRAQWLERKRQLLKLDVQGYELNVLRGATATLRSCAYVYAECSEMTLYEGQALRSEVEGFLAENGFRTLRRLNEQCHQGQLIQADYLFERYQ